MAQPDDRTDISSSDRSKAKRPGKKRDTPVVADAASNAIEFEARRPRGAHAGGTLALEPAAKEGDGAAGKKAGQERAAASAKPSILAARPAPIPDSVRERFIQIGNNFFFPDGAEAFTDHGNRVTTRSENAVVIQSMVAIAQSRAQGAVTVKGTDFFKREAWFAARLAGLEVRGYEPTALEQERLVRALARRRATDSEDVPRGADAEDGAKKGRKRSPRASSTADRERSGEEAGLLVGRLVDHGPARFEHKPNQPMSYYVRIETERGETERWGVDLERAFRQSLSRPGIGDEVGLRVVGRDDVTVLAPKHDAQGREVGLEERDAHRNQWIVERKDFLDRRLKMAALFRDPSVSAAEGVKQFPELEGSYLQLQVARAGVEERFASRAAREQFVQHLRAHLAKTIEYGQPLEPVRLRAREDRTPEPEKDRVQDRDYPAR